MNTELAIQKAVEGGWDSEECQVPIGARGRFNYDRAWLDPLFFKALGKNLGWGATKNFSGRKKDSLLDLWPEEWQVYQHLLIDAIQQGRSIDEFFGEILKK